MTEHRHTTPLQLPPPAPPLLLYSSCTPSEDEDYEDVDHEGSDYEDDDDPLSQRDSYVGASSDNVHARVIRRAWKGFEVEHGDVYKSITRILAEHHDGVRLTFRQIPRDALARMYDCFRTRWSWDPANEQAMHDGINVLKNRYRDIMRQLRVNSTSLAYVVRKDIDPTNYLQFDIIRDFPPPHMGLEVWRELCKRWNTPGWLKKSKSGSENRNKGDSKSRQTGGSMGYAERRARMKRKMNAEPNFKQIFLETTSPKNAKKIMAGEIDIYNLEELKFCTERASKAYGDYLSAMSDVYEPNFSKYPDDLEVWARVIGEGRTRRVYRVGSANLHVSVTGKSSSPAKSAPSLAEYQQSQEKAEVMRT